MTDERDWSDEERRALGALAEGPQPPSALEDATVGRLRRRGLLRGARPAWRVATVSSAAAAGLLLFALGLVVGARGAAASREAASSMPRFVLLLYDAPDEPRLSEGQREARVAEYRSWARRVRAGGREIGGEKLEREAAILGPSTSPAVAAGWPLGGYFVVSARDLEAAVELARSCPHLAHGGRVEVRAIART